MPSNEKSKLSSLEFEQIFRSNYRPLFYIGYQMSENRALTKDVIQNLFLDFWEKRERLEEVQNWNAYLRKSMHRKMIEALKKEKRRSTSASLDKASIQPSYEALLIKGQSEQKKKQQLENAIRNLPAAQKRALDLKYKEGLSYDEIAELTGKTKQTIYNQIFAAIQKLKDALLILLYWF